MSDYVYESGISSRRRRQRRTAITLLLTLLFLGGAFYWAWSYIRDGGTSTAAPTPTETAATCGENDPRAVTLNVYNASSRNGLAGSVAEELRARGFTIGAVSNDPLDASFSAPAQVRYGEPGRQQAALLRDVVEDEQVIRDERTTTDLDLVLGPNFTQLNPEPAGVPSC